MITASPLPMKVGVAPGTTTFTLGDPHCDSGPRALIQRFRLYLKKRLVTDADLLPPLSPLWRRRRRPVVIGPTPTSPAKALPSDPRGPSTTVSPSDPRAPRGVVDNAAARLRRAFSPYANFEEMRGSGLGYVLTPAGDNSPSPYGEIVASMKNAVWQRNAYCGTYDAQYHTRGEPGMYYDSPLGAIPSDLQLARIRGYTPVMSSWASFNQQSWAPLPWVPRIGTWTPDGLRPVGPVLNGTYKTHLGPRGRGLLGRIFGIGDDVATEAAQATAEQFDPGRAAVLELKRHQDRVFALSVVSTMAIASTAAINIVQHLRERRRKNKQFEPASPTAPVSGLGRSRRRARRGRR